VLGLPTGVTACVFDLDGVLTNTWSVHNLVWTETFDAFLQDRAERLREPFVPFDPGADFATYMDGRPQLVGVRDFLNSRDIDLPEGNPTDSPGMDTQNGLRHLKDEALLRRIHDEGVEVFDGARTYLEAARAAGLRRVVVSSSATCRDVLRVTGLASLVEGWIGSLPTSASGLGRPAPDAFLAGARCAGVEPHEAAVFEDALAGVAACRADGFGFVVGVDRTGHSDRLQAGEADVVVRDLAELLTDSSDSDDRAPQAQG
jgi:HAD superfamily hydrolase (TIGR01509 family)